jgi:hypothetical protein
MTEQPLVTNGKEGGAGASCLAMNDLLNLLHEDLRRKGLGEKHGGGRQPALLHFIHIAGEEKNLDAWPQCCHPLGQLVPVHVRHDDIGDQ